MAERNSRIWLNGIAAYGLTVQSADDVIVRVVVLVLLVDERVELSQQLVSVGFVSDGPAEAAAHILTFIQHLTR
jgi:hypothetical protein